MVIYSIVYCPVRTTRYANLKCWRNAPPPTPKKNIVLDPGHGLSCPLIRQPAGAVGETEFPPNDPPSGRLREDHLTMAIALAAKQQLSAKYNVILTKADVNSCPNYIDRGKIANNARARVFVSIHINAPLQVMGYPVPIPVPFVNGTSVLYNSEKPSSKALADSMSAAVAQNLGVNNRGAEVRDDLAVLKPTVTNNPIPAVLLEAARLSGSDEKALHSAGSAGRIATGIQTAIEAFVGN
ncbi:N-acetylmuramoyl-L-alanine amidase [Massilia cavernae]|uniref:N-acetylmuramoyl-L-alanine amidase n=1 Tax=Massilia cavernae TaxID=2320864 RepID=A0A418XUC5_9BURK|nr:N-acetylmuramoyl-L-alanine amidase [Massilia cavernae]RJG16332.1 N-acetylmuramoyl-L-alanine amidase [Massilia cavernae]